MNFKLFLYFFLAVLPALVIQDQPASPWEWFKWAALALYQGLLAVKAFTSDPKP